MNMLRTKKTKYVYGKDWLICYEGHQKLSEQVV